MKKILFIISIIGLALTSCDKDSLKLENPNEPGLGSLRTEVGIQKAALGVYHPMRYDYFIWFSQVNHNVMGDVTTVSAGNFGWRWVNQVTSITRPNGTVVNPPQGGSQPDLMRQYNGRDYGYDNPMNHEWLPLYGTLGHANLMLSILDEVEFTGSDTEKQIKKDTYKVWFLWWKGFVYSRIGSLYSKGIINDNYGELNTNYSTHEEVIGEAKKVFEEAKSILAKIDESDATYQSLITSFIPSSFRSGNGGFISPRMMERNINSYLARNILVNKYAKDPTDAELTEIETLASAGIRENDKIFTVKSDPNEDACFVYQTTWSAVRLLAGWENISERLVQDFKPGDNRFERNIYTLSSPIFNPRGRGLSYGTRYGAVDGGDYASWEPGFCEIPMACSYEETQLMLAEVKIRKNQIEAGLAHIDAVRDYQNAQLDAVANTNLNKDEALEELRKERRIGLFLKGTSFYDARRWGVLKPLSQGGGRQNANVVVASNGTVEPCTINYNYLEWWDVPANETDFNPIEIPNTPN